MLERQYDPTQPYQVVYYGRMSSSGQNKRSPDQQFATIEETQARCGYPWHCLQRYRDDGVSGRYVAKRPGLQQMLREVEAGLVSPDLIVVDTLERLGRAEEIGELRRKLAVEYGVLVVAADNSFADPTGVVGKAVTLVEAIRATEDTRIKRHNVIRGKKDAARQKQWPGGPVPFGYTLKKVIDESVSPPVVHSVLEPEPRQAAALRLAFARAAQTGEGDLRLSRWWNRSADIPADFKPISAVSMGYRLRSRIYVGELVWGAHRTGVVNDTRVVEANPDGGEVVPGFCDPLVSQELFDRVQRLRDARAARIQASRQKNAAAPAKRITPQVRGLTLKYLLTGLVRCGRCNASMRVEASGRRSKAGRRYVYYGCPRHNDGACDNGRHVPEDGLRAAIVCRLRARLFPAPGQQGQTPDWLPELLALVRQELRRYHADEPDRTAVVHQELKRLEDQTSGWMWSLGNPHLPLPVRRELEDRYAQATQRQQQLQQVLAADQARQRHLDETLDANEVIAQLHRLDEVLAGHNPTLGNLELSRHVDRITCHPDGRVELRGTLLGLFAGAVELLSRDEEAIDDLPHAAATDAFAPVQPRRRGRLRLPSLSAEGKATCPATDPVLDPQRFAGLPREFVWAETFVLAETLCWAEANAAEVARLRATGLTHERLASHFGKTVPTIRKALRLAAQTDEWVQSLPRKMPRVCWAKDHAAEVAQLQADGLSVPQIARRLSRSEPTIRAAVRHAEAQRDATAAPAPADDPA